MKEGRVTVHDIIYPVHFFCKLAGYSPHTFQRSKQIYTVSGIIIVITLLALKGILIWVNTDSSKFSNITNSSILNYGIWLQTETSLLLSIFFILIGLRKYECEWKLLETFVEVDNDFENVFYVKMFHDQTKRWILSIMVYGAVIQVVLISVTAYILSDLPLDGTTKYCTGLSIFLSNMCIASTANQFISSEMFILSRYRMVNNILYQLLFDSPEKLETNEIIGDEAMSIKEFGYTKYQNNFISENVLLRDQLEINTISKSEILSRKKEDLKKQKEEMDKMEKLDKKSSVFVPMSRIARKSYIYKYTFSKDSTIEDINQKLNTLYILHDKLSDCVDILNDMTGLQIQLVTLSIFAYVVFGLFARYCVWMNYQREAANIATMNICWICVYVHTLVFNIFAGTLLVDRAKETPLIIHRIMCINSNTELLDKFYQISEMLYSRQPFVGCGLLVYDWKYLFSLIGGVCMYLIILIQFYVSSPT